TALITPIDAVLLAISYVGEKFAAFNLYLADTATKIPGVGDQFVGLADGARQAPEKYASWKDEAQRVMQSHVDIVKGQGPLFEWTGKVKTAIDDARTAMQKQQVAACEAAISTTDLATANVGLVEGSGQAVVAMYNQNEQLEKMDDWNRKISNSHPFGVLLAGLTKVLPPLDETTTKANDAAAAAFLMGDHMSKAAPKLTGLGQAAIDMSDDVRFAAEVVADATAKALSFSEAMDLVRQGQGTMTGQVSAPGNVL